MHTKKKVLFINDTARNGGPGRSLYYILKFLDTNRFERHVLLPRKGVISEMYAAAGITESISFEPGLIENPFEPWDRAMSREDFDVSLWTKSVRLACNIGRISAAMMQLALRIKKEKYDLI